MPERGPAMVKIDTGRLEHKLLAQIYALTDGDLSLAKAIIKLGS